MNIQTLPWPKHIGLKHTKTIKLIEDCFVEQWIVPRGTEVKLLNTTNFGFVVLPHNTQDARGFTIPRRFFSY